MSWNNQGLSCIGLVNTECVSGNKAGPYFFYCFIPENHQGWVISTSLLCLVRLLSFSWKMAILNVHKGIADLSTSELWERLPMGNGHLEAGALARPYRQAGFNCKPLHQCASVNCCKCSRGGLE